MLKKFFYIFFGLLIFFLVNFLNFSVHENVFNSADEAANYQITKQYGTNGILYLTGDHLNIDKGNNLHMRGFITYNNKLVPFNFLGLPLFYGPFYAILGENIKYINIFLMIIIVFVLLKTFTNLFNIRGKDTIILSSIFGLLVMLYYISHPYFNIVPFLPFFFLFLYYIFKFQKTENIKYLYFAIFFSLIAIRMRYEQIIIIGLFLIIHILVNKNIYLKIKNKLFLIFGLGVMMLFVFILPLIKLNHELYGNYMTYGYSLFNKIFFPERISSPIRSILNIFFPGMILNFGVLWINITNNLFFLLPPFYFLAWLYILNGKHSLLQGKNKYYGILFLYIILQEGMSPTYGSGGEVTVFSAINRYRIILHMIFFIFFVLYLIRFQKKNNLSNIYILLFIIICVSSNLYSLRGQYNILSQFENSNEVLITNGIKGKYIIDPINDKYIYAYNKPITWRGGAVDSDVHFKKGKEYIINTIKYILLKNESIYALESKYFSINYHFNILTQSGIGFTNITGNIYKLYLMDEKK